MDKKRKERKLEEIVTFEGADQLVRGFAAKGLTSSGKTEKETTEYVTSSCEEEQATVVSARGH